MFTYSGFGSKEKTLSNKYKHRLEGNSGHVEKLEKELQREKEEQKRQLELLETEVNCAN